MSNKDVIIRFCKTKSGNEPVVKWLRSLTVVDMKKISIDIQSVKEGWPLGMPLVKKIKKSPGIWEIRTNLTDGKIARVLFTKKKGILILVHGFIKKTQETPVKELEIAIKRIKNISE